AGKPYVSAETADRLLSTIGSRPAGDVLTSPLNRLSDRERRVLELMGSGLTTRDIARQLQRSVKTVETHYAHIKQKNGARNIRELIRIAVSAGMDGPKNQG